MILEERMLEIEDQMNQHVEYLNDEIENLR
jgi:hypothetical protein